MTSLLFIGKIGQVKYLLHQQIAKNIIETPLETSPNTFQAKFFYFSAFYPGQVIMQGLLGALNIIS